MGATSSAQRESYIEKAYDTVIARIPKGVRAIIDEVSDEKETTMGAYAREAIYSALRADGKGEALDAKLAEMEKQRAEWRQDFHKKMRAPRGPRKKLAASADAEQPKGE